MRESSRLKSEASANRLIEDVGRKLNVDADIRIVALDTDADPFLRKLAKVPGALILGE